jgi:glycosyltransferase involved in cell wall biosynthesis
MLTLPLVSICIPTYNGARYLREALDSLAIQDYPNVEVILSDDSSDDQTLEIASRFSSLSMQIYSHPRLGLVGNWNFCISVAKGKYIKFLFQDDYLAPGCITKLVQAAESYENVGLVFSPRHIEIENDTAYAASLRQVYLSWSELNPIQAGIQLLEDPMLTQVPYNKVGEPSNTLIARQAITQFGGFDVNFRQLCDLEMWLRLMAHYNVAFVDEYLSTFRVHINQTTAINFSQGRPEQEGPAWQEIYFVWMKVLNHVSFEGIPVSIKRRIHGAIQFWLLREFIRSTIKAPWRFKIILSLAGQYLRSILRISA